MLQPSNSLTSSNRKFNGQISSIRNSTILGVLLPEALYHLIQIIIKDLI